MKTFLYKDLFNQEEKHWWHKAKRKSIEALFKKHIPLSKSPIILDVGCGTGKNADYFSKFGNVFGLDASQKAIKFCKKRGLKNILLGSAEKMPFKKNQFDVLLMLDVLEHIDDKKSLDESFRVLKKTGLIIITVPAYKWLWSKWDEILHHKRRYNHSELESVLSKSGFKMIKSSYLYSFLLIPVVVARTIKSATSKDNYSSDFSINSVFIDKLFSLLADVERFLMLYTYVPFGLSIVAIAKKNDQK